MSRARSYHVYSSDGFKSAHDSLDDAKATARREAALRGVTYRVIQVGGSGSYTYEVTTQSSESIKMIRNWMWRW